MSRGIGLHRGRPRLVATLPGRPPVIPSSDVFVGAEGVADVTDDDAGLDVPLDEG